MVKVPSFPELSQTAKDVLYGGKSSGPFQYNQQVSLSSTTAEGVTFALTAVKKDGTLDMGLKSTYSSGNYSVVSTVSQAGKLGVAATYKELVPGLVVGLSGTLPDVESGKLALDYSMPHLTAKTAVSLTASPKVDVALTSGYDKVTVGGETSYDAAKGALTKWVLGAGYNGGDYQAAVYLNDAQVLTGQYAHSVTASATLATEVAHNLGTKVTTFSAGLSKRLEGGALVKSRLDNNGLVSVLYEQEVKPKTKMGISAQFDALNLEKAPKLGFAYDLKY